MAGACSCIPQHTVLRCIGDWHLGQHTIPLLCMARSHRIGKCWHQHTQVAWHIIAPRSMGVHRQHIIAQHSVTCVAQHSIAQHSIAYQIIAQPMCRLHTAACSRMQTAHIILSQHGFNQHSCSCIIISITVAALQQHDRLSCKKADAYRMHGVAQNSRPPLAAQHGSYCNIAWHSIAQHGHGIDRQHCIQHRIAQRLLAQDSIAQLPKQHSIVMQQN